MPASRWGTLSRSTTMPMPPLAAISLVEKVSPAAPMSWMPTMRPRSMTSRQASRRSFSLNGSPTWTLGRLGSASSPKPAAAMAADRRDPDRIAVAGDAGDDAFHDRPVLRIVGRPEAQGVHDGDGPGAHGEDVAEDAADARGRARVGPDVGRGGL